MEYKSLHSASLLEPSWKYGAMSCLMKLQDYKAALFDCVKLGLNQNNHWTEQNILFSIIKPSINLKEERTENGSLIFEWA